MGRGRAKAKQTKVARELKYGGPQTDLYRLQAELAGSAGNHVAPPPVSSVDVPDDLVAEDPYAKYYDDDADPVEERDPAN